MNKTHEFIDNTLVIRLQLHSFTRTVIFASDFSGVTFIFYLRVISGITSYSKNRVLKLYIDHWKVQFVYFSVFLSLFRSKWCWPAESRVHFWNRPFAFCECWNVEVLYVSNSRWLQWLKLETLDCPPKPTPGQRRWLCSTSSPGGREEFGRNSWMSGNRTRYGSNLIGSEPYCHSVIQLDLSGYWSTAPHAEILLLCVSV